MSREASFREPVPLERRLKEPAATPERQFDPWSNRWSYRNSEAYPTNTTGYGAMHTPQERLTKTAKGEYGGDATEYSAEDLADLKTIEKILKKKPHLRAAAQAPVESYRENYYGGGLTEEDCAVLDKRAMCAEAGLPPDRYAPLPSGIEDRYIASEQSYRDDMNALAQSFLPAHASAEAKAVFGFGRKRLREMGAIARDGWA
jgi:hypothetical protein